MDELEAYEIEQTQSRLMNNELELNNLERSVIVLENLVNIAQVIEAKKSISAEDRQLIRIATEMAVAGTDQSGSCLIPGLENINNPNIALENVIDNIKDSLTLVGSHIGHYFKKELDHLEAFYTFFQMQSNKILDLKRKLNTKSFKNVSISIDGSKYLQYDDYQNVKDFHDYYNQFVKMAMFTRDFNKLSAEFVKKDLMSSFKTLVSPITGYDDNYREMFESTMNLCNNASKLHGVNKIGETGKHIDFHSDTFLGMSHLEVKIAKKDTFDMKYTDSLKSVVNNYYMTFVREDKFQIETFKRNVILDNVNSNDLHKLLDRAEEMIESYEQGLALRNKLSNIGATHVITDAVFSAVYPLRWWVFLLASYRLLVRNSMIIYNTQDSAIVFSRGNIGKLMAITERALKRS